MTDSIQAVHRALPPRSGPLPYTLETARQVRAFHRSFPEYAPTPLVRLRELAAALGVAEFYVKDESKRFGLNAFKVLGGSWAIGRCIARKLGLEMDQVSCSALTSPETRAKLGDLTFVTATDGNHGRGVAWTAARLGMRSVVYMPRGTAPERLANIRALGSDAGITDLLYDDAVRLAARQAEEKGWILVQDTSWEGYEEVPGWIMEGYTTLGLEAAEQLGDTRPTHIFLQAGVGSLAGALAGFFTNYYDKAPTLIVVEPHAADCLFRTAQAADGKLHSAEGSLSTIMAGLACGEPCSLAWEVLDRCAAHFLLVPDPVAAKGMRILGNPLGEDTRIISGESGASTAGTAAEILLNPALAGLKERLGLGPDSRILCVSTEGDTDRANYRSVVWDGRYPSM